jgi:hypothetical protein
LDKIAVRFALIVIVIAPHGNRRACLTLTEWALLLQQTGSELTRSPA